MQIISREALRNLCHIEEATVACLPLHEEVSTSERISVFFWIFDNGPLVHYAAQECCSNIVRG